LVCTCLALLLALPTRRSVLLGSTNVIAVANIDSITRPPLCVSVVPLVAPCKATGHRDRGKWRPTFALRAVALLADGARPWPHRRAIAHTPRERPQRVGKNDEQAAAVGEDREP